MTLTAELVDQLAFHWDVHLRPRLTGLTTEEYRWEPVPGWSVRDGTIDFAFPEPDPPPFTTIAWRMAHVIVGVFGMRTASHFGGPPMDYATFPYADTADVALAQLDDAYAGWIDGVRALDDAALARPVGPAEGPYADRPMLTLVLHIDREAIHHGAEMLLLRDLFRAREDLGGTPGG